MAQLQEVNPMLGFRGCRLSVVYPEITEMQARAIASAAAANKKVPSYERCTEATVPRGEYRRVVCLL